MKKEITLLDQAKKILIKRKNLATNEHIELALAWLKDEINMSQAAKVLGYKSTSNIGYSFAICFKKGYQQGKIKIQ